MRTKIIITISFSFLLSFNLYSQWVPIGPPGGLEIPSLASTGNIFFAGGNSGIYCTTDNGQNWTHTALINKIIMSLAVSGNNIFAGTAYYGVWISTDNGNNWTQTSLNQFRIPSIAFSENNIFAATLIQGVYLSSNNGQNWIQTAPLTSQYVMDLVISGNNIFAGTYGYGVSLSTNNGQNWMQTALNNQFVWSLALSGNNLFAGVRDSGVFLSTNYGQSWSQTALNNQFVSALAVSGNNIFAGTDSGVYLSTNNGQSWMQKNDGFYPNTSVISFLVSNNYIFAGTLSNSVWKRPLQELIGINNISSIIPCSFSLSQNYPNPFNPTTKIKFSIPQTRLSRSGGKGVKLIIYDLSGKEVATPVIEKLQPGTYEVEFDGSNLSSGVYFYRLSTDNYVNTKKMVLLR